MNLDAPMIRALLQGGNTIQWVLHQGLLDEFGLQILLDAFDEVERLRSPSCPANHPAACIVSSGEGTSYCSACAQVAALTARLAEVSASAERAWAEVAELRDHIEQMRIDGLEHGEYD